MCENDAYRDIMSDRVISVNVADDQEDVEMNCNGNEDYYSFSWGI